MLAAVAFRFWVEANEAKLEIIELAEENRRLKAKRKKTSCSPSSTPDDAIVAAFSFGLTAASPRTDGLKRTKADLSQDDPDGEDNTAATGGVGSTASSGET